MDVQKNPLSVACFYGHHETAKFLLEKGAIIQENAMKYAVEKDFRYHLSYLQLLLLKHLHIFFIQLYS